MQRVYRSMTYNSITIIILLLQGMCGPNVEYLMKLIWYSRALFPHFQDDHLDELEREIHHIAKLKGDTLETYSLHEF